jgi:uncharacterized membrane protein
MGDKTFSIKEALRFGWDTLQVNVVLYLKLLAVLIVLSLVPALILGKIATAAGGLFGIALQFLNIVWQSILGMGVLKICLKLYDKQTVEFSDLWSSAPLILNYLITKFLFSGIVLVGFILFIIPGMIWLMQFYMSTYLVIDRGATPMQALKASSAITSGAKWDLGAFTTVSALLNIAGLLALGVGIMITLPVTMLASVHIYRTLLAKTPTANALISA